MVSVFLLLGSNLGDRFHQLQGAAEILGRQVGSIIRRSMYYETEPWGLAEQPHFLNQALHIKTALAPDVLLRVTQNIENTYGTKRPQRWGARRLDIDLLDYDNQSITLPHLTLPHPQLAHRRFTLVPLVEIAPSWKHPTLNQTSLTLLKGCKDPLKVTPYPVPAS